METVSAAPQSRIARASATSRFFAGAAPSPSPAVPAIAMPMHLALDGRSCAVTDALSGRAAFAKAHHAGALAPYHVEGAVEASSKAAEAGLSPALLEWDPTEGVLLFERLDAGWRMALAHDLQQPSLKQAAVTAKKAWHGTPLLTRSLSPFDVARDYCRRLEPCFASDAATPFPYKGGLPFPSLRDWLDRIEAALVAAGTDIAPVHGENTVSNIMIGPGGSIRLVDFDRAVNADPLLDLGGLSLDLCRNDDERMELVELYSGRADGAFLARVKLYGLVDDFLWGCWASLAEINAATRGPELLKYASNRFVRMSYHLQVFDMANLLRKV